MEISSVDEGGAPSPIESDDSDKYGKLAFALCVITGLAAAAPGVFKKKRQYQLAPQMAPEMTPPIAIPEAGDNSPPFPRGTEEQRNHVIDIFSTVATKWSWDLINEQKRLEDIEEYQIKWIHPFFFLHSAPKEHVQTIFRGWNRFKQSNVLDGIRRGMERERQNLELYLPSFAAAMGKPAEQIRPLIQAADWQGLVNLLYDINS
jgi:hypothetical protein